MIRTGIFPYVFKKQKLPLYLKKETHILQLPTISNILEWILYKHGYGNFNNSLPCEQYYLYFLNVGAMLIIY